MSDSPCKTPQNKIKRFKNGGTFGTPMFIPPTPQLQSLGYGTGVEVYRIERSPRWGNVRSPWAIKRITKRSQNDKEQSVTFNQRLADEADILSNLVHPNIVGFRGLPNTQDGRTALVMESCDTSLGDILEARHESESGPLEAKRITKICGDILKALDYLHTTAKVLHGDIKSFNILIKDGFGVCKLCDFGVSLPLNDSGFVDLKQKPNAEYIGTPLWCAPEVLIDDNEENISSKSDIFSFGLVIYECIALIPPHSWAMSDNCGENSSVIEIEDNIVEDDSIIDLDKTEESVKSIQDSEIEEEGIEDKLATLYGTRPPMPECEDLPIEYNVIMELFYLCTNQNPEDRPSAGSVCNMFDEE